MTDPDPLPVLARDVLAAPATFGASFVEWCRTLPPETVVLPDVERKFAAWSLARNGASHLVSDLDGLDDESAWKSEPTERERGFAERARAKRFKRPEVEA